MSREGRPSEWKPYHSESCAGCTADCCRLPVEVTARDLETMGLLSADEVRGSPKKILRRLKDAGVLSEGWPAVGVFFVAKKASGECVFLGNDRRCQIYERRPEVCRRFPDVGPRPGFCPRRV